MPDTLGNEIPLRIKMASGHPVPLHPEDCESHTKSPARYLQWHEWAEKMDRTHTPRQCRGCGLWSVWEKREQEQSA